MEEQNFETQQQPVSAIPQPTRSNSHHYWVIILSLILSVILSVGASFLYLQWTLDQRDTDSKEKLAQMFAGEKRKLDVKIIALDAEVLALKERFENDLIKQEVVLLSNTDFENEFYRVSYPAEATVKPPNTETTMLTIELDGGKILIAKKNEAPSPLYDLTGKEPPDYQAKMVPVEEYDIGEGENLFKVFLYRDLGRDDLLDTLRAIKDSIVLK